MIVDIIQWNPIHANDFAATIKPSVYIKPTIEILDLFNRAPMNRVLLKITGTNSPYDNSVTFGIIDKSSDVPNKRDNLFDCDGLYIITIVGMTWQGYPSDKGKIELLEGTVEASISYLMKQNETKENFVDPPASRTSTTSVPVSIPTSVPTSIPTSVPTSWPSKHGFSRFSLAMIGIFLTLCLIITIWFYRIKH